ncbi:MAG: glycosyltransferase family 4 protein [Nitrospirota bacterium]
MSAKQKLNIWLTQATEPLPMICKLRTSLYADKFIERGHNVIWFASAFDHFSKKWIYKKDTDVELENGVKIKALKGIGYKKNISLARYIDHRVVTWKFKKMAPNMERPDIIIASMPSYDLAYEAVVFAKKNIIPVIVDIRDPWPDLFLDHVHPRLRSLIKVLLYKDFQMIKETMKMAYSITAVTKTFLEWGLNYAEREKTWRDRVFPHGYKVSSDLNNNEPPERFKKVFDVIKKKFNVFFVGTISNSYHNPLILLEAAKKLVNYNDIHFIIAGDGELFLELEKDTQNLSNVTVTGWLDKKEIEFFLQHSKIGVCPLTAVVDLPTNKAYSYLSAGLPIISAFQGDLKEVIEKYQIGFYYPPNDVDALVNCIKKLYEEELYKQMSENARRVFEEMYDANKIYEEYVEHIERIARDYE